MWNPQLRNVKGHVARIIWIKEGDLYGCCYPDEKCNPADPWSPYTEQTKVVIEELKNILQVIEREEATLT